MNKKFILFTKKINNCDLCTDLLFFLRLAIKRLEDDNTQGLNTEQINFLKEAVDKAMSTKPAKKNS